MALTPLPTPPSRSDSATFAARADAWNAAMVLLCTQINALPMVSITGSLNGVPVGDVTPTTGAFTTLAMGTSTQGTSYVSMKSFGGGIKDSLGNAIFSQGWATGQNNFISLFEPTGGGYIKITQSQGILLGSGTAVTGALSSTAQVSGGSFYTAGNINVVGAAAWVGASVGASYTPDDGVVGGIINNGGGFRIATAAVERIRIDASAGNITPGTNGTQSFGSTSLRWSQVWCTAGVFNSSNALLKTAVKTLTDSEKQAASQFSREIGIYQWLASVKEKGDAARRHIGMTVQRAEEILNAHGLDAWSYGFMGYDKWDEVTAIVDCAQSDDGSYPVEVTRKKTVKVARETSKVEIIDGVPTLVKMTVEVDQPVTVPVQVRDDTGAPCFTAIPEVPEVLGKDGDIVQAAQPSRLDPVMHPMPVLETVTVFKRVVVTRPAGEDYAFRYEQLNLFIAAGLESRIIFLEKQ